jgi:ribosomal protein S17
MQFKFVSIFTMMVFFVASAQNVIAQKSPEPIASIQAVPKISIEELINKGTVTVDDKTKQITVKLDGKKFDPKILANLRSQKQIKVTKDFEINKSVTNVTLKNAKVASTSILIPRGTYDIDSSKEDYILICCLGRCIHILW